MEGGREGKKLNCDETVASKRALGPAAQATTTRQSYCSKEANSKLEQLLDEDNEVDAPNDTDDHGETCCAKTNGSKMGIRSLAICWCYFLSGKQCHALVSIFNACKLFGVSLAVNVSSALPLHFFFFFDDPGIGCAPRKRRTARKKGIIKFANWSCMILPVALRTSRTPSGLGAGLGLGHERRRRVEYAKCNERARVAKGWTSVRRPPREMQGWNQEVNTTAIFVSARCFRK